MGTLTQHVPVGPFLDGWRRARSTDPGLASASMHVFGHLGFFPGSVGALRAKLPRDGEDGVHYEGPVPKAEVGTAYSGLDVLVLMLARGPLRHLRKGLRVHGGRPADRVRARPGQCCHRAPPGVPAVVPGPGADGEEVARALREAAAAARAADPALAAAARAHAARYTRDSQLAGFERELRALAGHPRPAHGTMAEGHAAPLAEVSHA